MSGKNKFRAVIAGAFGPILLGIVPNSASADEVFAPTAAITIPGNNLASFDISWVDKRLDLYFLADRSNSSVDVVNTRNNQFVAHLPGFIGLRGADNSGPNGVITVHRRNHVEVWAGDGDSTTKVIDLATQTVTHTIATGGANRADELCHDPRNNVVLIANDAETPAPFITFISSDTYTVLGKITMDGGIRRRPRPQGYERHRAVPMERADREVLYQPSGGERSGRRFRIGRGSADQSEDGGDRAGLHDPGGAMCRTARHGDRPRSSESFLAAPRRLPPSSTNAMGT